MSDRGRCCPPPSRARPAIPSLLLAALLASAAAAQQPADTTRGVSPAEQIQRLLRRVTGPTQVAVLACDVESRRPLFAHAAELPLKPASVLKLLVAAAAVEHFADEFGFETRFLRSGNELWVLGAGDPALGDERLLARRGLTPTGQLNDWARRIGESFGAEPIERIVLDDSVFDQQLRHPDWPAEQYLQWYQAPVSGLCFNDNCLDVSLRVLGRDVTIITTPPLPAEFTRNGLVLGRTHKPSIHRAADSDVFELRGSLTRSDALEPASIHRPAVVFGHALSETLRRAGVTVAGPVVRRTLPAENDARELFVERTPLRDVLWRCNNFSQNLFAECLLKSLSAYDAAGQRIAAGSWAGGLGVERQVLERLGVDLAGAELRDGSGLSHQNRVTAAQIVAVLLAMKEHPRGAAFVESLARPGEDGTLRRRFTQPALRDRLRAKTGTIRGAHTLAGYLTRTDGGTSAFAILINGGANSTLQVQIVDALAAITPAAP